MRLQLFYQDEMRKSTGLLLVQLSGNPTDVAARWVCSLPEGRIAIVGCFRFARATCFKVICTRQSDVIPSTQPHMLCCVKGSRQTARPEYR